MTVKDFQELFKDLPPNAEVSVLGANGETLDDFVVDYDRKRERVFLVVGMS